MKILGVSRVLATDRPIARNVRAETQLKASEEKARHVRVHPPFAQSARLYYPTMAIPTPNTVQTAKHHKSPLGALNRAPDKLDLSGSRQIQLVKYRFTKECNELSDEPLTSRT